MYVSTNKAVGRQFKQFASIDDKRTRHRRCIDPDTVLTLNTQARYDILKQHGHEATVLMCANALLAFSNITTRIANDFQKLRWVWLINLRKEIFTLAKCLRYGFQNIDTYARDFRLIRKQ
ncbi:hypothetical protein D3C80_690110 [compost metagenome]